jgi:hypothetical protein
MSITPLHRIAATLRLGPELKVSVWAARGERWALGISMWEKLSFSNYGNHRFT